MDPVDERLKPRDIAHVSFSLRRKSMKKLVLAGVIAALIGLGLYAGVAATGMATTPAVAADS
jgi:hypothetical protein